MPSQKNQLRNAQKRLLTQRIMRPIVRKPNRQKTETKRRAIDSLVGRIVKQRREWGEPLPSSTDAQKRMVAIAERSDRDRASRKPKPSPVQNIEEPSAGQGIVRWVTTDEYRENWERIFRTR